MNDVRSVAGADPGPATGSAPKPATGSAPKPATDTAAVLAKHETIPARAGAASRVLQLADDPDTSAPDLARAIATDPFFAARVLRVANSTYYGLSGRVSTLPFAVSVVGFQAVRSLAVVAAAGLDDPQGVPEGFWQVTALCASGCDLLAPMLGADPGDAFSVGLLHTLGSALLHQEAPPATLCLPLSPDVEGLLAVEQDQHGIAHDLLAARVLEAWQFPAHVWAAIGRHHEPLLPDAAPLERTLHVARALTDVVLSGESGAVTSQAEFAWLTEGRLTPPDLPALMDRMATRSAALLEGLSPRG